MLFGKKTKSTVTVKTRDRIDYAVAKNLFAKADYDLAALSRTDDICARYNEIIASGHTPLIIDAGANIGASTLYFANEFPAARVIGIEPEPGNFKLAGENCGGTANIEMLQAGLAGSPGKAAINNPG